MPELNNIFIEKLRARRGRRAADDGGGTGDGGGAGGLEREALLKG